jgi:Cytochrome c3
MNKKKKSIIPLILMAAITFGVIINSAIAKNQDESLDEIKDKGIENNVFSEDNENCLKCHGEKMYVLTDSVFGIEKKQSMCIENRINRDDFYNSVHWSFACLDCHSDEYNAFPHAISLRFEEYWTCLDCHGYDENFAQYQFEKIDEEHMKSIHYTATDGNFSCWECHDPHTYKLLTRTNENVSDVILESNNMCLKCHGNEEKFALLSARELGDVVPKHDWLPNQNLHFQAVRCIECHSEINDSLLVSHNIMSSENAVKKCVDCHSSNSILLGTLYKYQAKESRARFGFINGAIINNDAYVIGANRSSWLNIASLIIFGLTLGAIVIHTLFRITTKK